MFTKFAADSRRVVKDAREIAQGLESPTVEAEHLLLAIAHRTETPAHRLLAEAGLGYDEVRDALDAEFEASLAAVGVTLRDFDLTATPVPARTPRWGASAALALKRCSRIATARRDRRITPSHILLGVLRAPAGTVPRALHRASVDRAELGREVEAAL
jgi:ATP-dependent Clp protease ATP-binding subunit ClpA